MPDEIYTIKYVADTSSAIKHIRQLAATIAALDAQVEQSKQKLSGAFGGGARSATNATKKINDLVTALNGVPAAASAAGSATSTAMKGIHAGAGNANGSSSELLATLKKFGAAGIALGAVTKGLNMVAKAAEDAKKHLNQGAQGGVEQREKAREYATLMGKNTVDDEVMTRMFGLAQAGGSKLDDAREYGQAFMGSVTTGRDAHHINPEQEKILEKEGLLFGNRVGIDKETAGRLAGSLSQFTDLTKDEKGNPLTTQQGVEKQMGQFNALHYGLNEGVGKISTLARNELGAAAPTLGAGHLKDHAELGAFAGIASTIGKGASSTGNKYTQMDKLVNETRGEEGEFLKSIGVADQQGDLEKLRVLKKYMDAQRAAAADPAKFDPIAHLKEKGFGSHEEVSSTVGFLSNFDVLELRVKNARQRASDGQSALQANQEFINSQDGQAGQAQAIGEAGVYEQTRKRQRLAAARMAALGQLQAEGKIDTFNTNLTDEFKDGTVNLVRPNTEHEARVDQRVWENARKAAKRAGIEKEVDAADQRFLDPSGKGDARYVEGSGPFGMKDLGTYASPYDGQNSAKLDEFLNRFGPKIEGAKVPINGNQVPVGTNKLDQDTQALDRIAPQASAVGGKVEAPEVKEAGKMMVAAVDRLGGILSRLDMGGSSGGSSGSRWPGSPGDHLGLGYGPDLS